MPRRTRTLDPIVPPAETPAPVAPSTAETCAPLIILKDSESEDEAEDESSETSSETTVSSEEKSDDGLTQDDYARMEKTVVSMSERLETLERRLSFQLKWLMTIWVIFMILVAYLYLGVIRNSTMMRMWSWMSWAVV